MRARILDSTGVRVPGLRFRGNDGDLPNGSYIIMLNEIPIVMGRLEKDARLYPGSPHELAAKGLPGVPGSNPVSGEEAAWIPSHHWQAAQDAGIELWGPAECLVFHVEAVLKRYLPDFVGHQEMMNLLEGVGRSEAYRGSEGEDTDLTLFTGAARLLLNEGVPLTPFAAVETNFQSVKTARTAETVETMRLRAETRAKLPGNSSTFRHLLLPEAFETIIEEGVRRGGGIVLTLEPDTCQKLLAALREKLTGEHRVAVVVARHDLRPFVRQLLEGEWPAVPVLAARELLDDLRPDPKDRIIFRGTP